MEFLDLDKRERSSLVEKSYGKFTGPDQDKFEVLWNTLLCVRRDFLELMKIKLFKDL